MAEQLVQAVDTDTSPVNGDAINHDGLPATFQYVNGTDVSVDFVVEATYGGDTNFADAVELGSTTVASGSTDRDSISEEWDTLRVNITFTGDPTSGTAEAYLHKPRKR